jgi:hypothetical protein
MIKINNSLNNGKIFLHVIIAIFVLSSATLTVSTASAKKEFLPPNYVFSTNYYDSFGAPDIYASVLGDPEFERGETALLKINLVNKGVLYGFKYDTTVETDEGKHAISLKELEYETLRTTAIGIKAELASTTRYIDVEPDTSIQTLESIRPGELQEDPLSFTITLSNKAPAGVYYLQLLLSYEYPSQVRMTTNDVVRLGIVDLDHITYYTSANKTLTIPVYIEESPQFEVTNISGYLVAGESRTIGVTYENTGEITAEDSIVRMVVMRPLSIKQSVVRLGTMIPGENKTTYFEIGSEPDAVVKTYGIDSEIKYYNEDGETEFSDNLEISVPLEAKEKKIGIGMVAIVGVLVVLLYLVINTIRNIKKYE